MPLISAEVIFLDTNLRLIHIPLHLYSYFLQAILPLLFPLLPEDNDDDDDDAPDEIKYLQRTSWASRNTFLNVSITPVECSIACSSDIAEKIFAQIKEAIDQISPEDCPVTISDDEFVVFQVDGQGLDAGQRVLELTSPLALAGISIFFITTYFSDYILVPRKSRSHVIAVLERRGFAFDNTSLSLHASNTPPPTSNGHNRNTSSSSSFEVPPPSTPPPSTISELQTRTFTLLKRRNVVPRAYPDIRLVQCAGRHDSPKQGMHHETTLQFGLIRFLGHQPRFMNLTLTRDDPASILLPVEAVPLFGDEVLSGNKEEVLCPITLDLRALPLEVTGIVCGVAGRLAGRLAIGNGQLGEGSVEMSYLSTARAGTVIVGEEELERAMGALEMGVDSGNGKAG
ncbi:MAG: hypothetical protein M1834_004338 [Cirrosporium novae-zelandiae]|nr:MAG: hypothetical protein M1834_004338 [Cirrosporium novae-zelandiae]